MFPSTGPHSQVLHSQRKPIHTLKNVVHKTSVRNLFPILVSVSVLLLSVLRVSAIIDVTLQMQLGNPSGAIADPNNHDHYLIQRTVEAMDYSDNLGEPYWVSWDLTTADVGNVSRSTKYFPDTNLPPSFYLVTDNDYIGVGNINFNRGHMCPSEDRTDTRADNDALFFMSNIIPQAAVNNQGVWGNFEGDCRNLANAGNELLIICGPSGFGTNRIPSGKAAIANYTWKIVVVVPLGAGTALSRITASTRVISLKIPNSNNVTANWSNYVTSASQVQVDTGFTFFTALSPAIASALRNKVDGQTSPSPGIVSFSPTTGATSSVVVITGTNFGSTVTVAFNGVSATFNQDSATQITATVPAAATSGQISITTPSGTAISSGSFTVTGSTPADLAITATHTGNFTQGDTGDTYTINVMNVGGLATSGTITVTDALPASVTATAISGQGWTANLNTLTCTRSDALAPGVSYPPIAITVNIAANAPASVANIAMVSGGGDANTANNTASDPTTINTVGVGGGTNVLVGWDMSGLAGGSGNFGTSPLSPTTNAPNLTVVGLTRGAGVGASGTGAARGWGGNTFTNSTSAAAVAANEFATFTVSANAGYKVSYGSISKFDYRRSSTGPPSGVLQYQIGSGAFTDIAIFSYTATASSGGSLNAIDLSGISALQNVNAGSNVTFRIVNWGGTGSSGTWYIYDVASSSALDFAVQGTLATINSAVAPGITAQPQSTNIIAGSNAIFNVTATGTAPLSYQWQLANTNLPTATNATLTLTNVAANQAGAYRVVVTNSAGLVVSSNAVMSVYATAAASLSSIAYSSDQFHLSIAGVPGYNYAVQVSSNLTNWVYLQTNAAPFSFTDTNAGSYPSRFYRAVYLP
jgi:DNA/RNA endonuclease G (NUC1)